MILRGYFDDSGSNAQEPVYVLAGFLGAVEGWADFSDAWRAVLDKPRPGGGKGLDYFKANEAHRLKREFEGWSEAERDARVLELAEVIPQYATHRVSAHISRADFERAMARFDAAKPGNDPTFPLNLDPYFLLFYQLIVSIAWVRQQDNMGADCEYVFDHQGALGHRTAGYWDIAKQALSDSLRPWAGQAPIHQDDKVILPLQAADLYAWHWRKLAKDPAASTPPAMLPLLRMHKIIRTTSAERIEETVDEIIQAWASGAAAQAQQP